MPAGGRRDLAFFRLQFLRFFPAGSNYYNINLDNLDVVN